MTDSDAVPQAQCPACTAWVDDHDGFGVLAHVGPEYEKPCGYCSHPSIDDGVCGICEKRIYENLPTHALSLYAPWAFAILSLGKTIENRDWKRGRGFMRDAKFRGAFWLQASLFGGERGAKLEELKAECWSVIRTARAAGATVDANELLRWSIAARGMIVGRARVVDVVEESASPWFCGPVGLVLDNPIALSEQVRCGGALGFWRVPEPELEQLRRFA